MSTEDRELLELAAKAAGYEWRADIAEFRNERSIAGLWIVEPLMTNWNPLTDDGDALRLAVKLDIAIWEFSQYRCALTEVRYGKARGEYTEVGDDPYAATRRAIVRAAAEIGRTM